VASDHLGVVGVDGPTARRRCTVGFSPLQCFVLERKKGRKRDLGEEEREMRSREDKERGEAGGGQAGGG
jgi:hypothetical protein